MESKSSSSVLAFAPASVANVGCGFDTFGFAIERPGDYVQATLNDEPRVTIASIHGDGGALPLIAEKNTAGIAVLAMLKELNQSKGISLSIHKHMPSGSGLGSSAASAAAAVTATNAVFGNPFLREELLPFVVEAEAFASGSPHADNAAPSLLGGFITARTPYEVTRLPVPEQLICTVVHPHIEILTHEARAILPQSIPLVDAKRQWANTASMVAALLQGDLALFGRCIEDLIIEPARKSLIPGFDAMKQIALSNGALGCSISGSGPSVFAMSTSPIVAKAVGHAMQGVLFEKASIGSDLYISSINQAGAHIVPHIESL